MTDGSQAVEAGGAATLPETAAACTERIEGCSARIRALRDREEAFRREIAEAIEQEEAAREMFRVRRNELTGSA